MRHIPKSWSRPESANHLIRPTVGKVTQQRAGSHVLCEAKGRLSDSEGRFLSGTPGCIDAGKAQFNKVEVTNLSGRRIATRNWIAANLWSTDRVKRIPVSLLWDPPGEGETLTREEAERHAQAMRRQRDETVAARLGP